MPLPTDIDATFARQLAILETGGYWNCLVAAATLAQLLLQQGRHPWIGRLRKLEERDGVRIHWPLIALGRPGGRTWTTHYVCIADAIVFDPVGGEPLPLTGYAQRVFGEDIPVEVHISQMELVDYLAASARLASARVSGVPATASGATCAPEAIDPQ